MKGSPLLRVYVFALGVALSVALSALPAGAVADSCPNAVFRNGPSSRLPDCRAYEMVTPPYKEGFPVLPEGFAEDGSHMWGESLGVFAGSEDSVINFGALGLSKVSNGSSYIFTRGESGWTTTAISPPPSQYPSNVLLQEGGFVGLSPDFASSLWLATTPAQEETARSDGVHESTMASIYLRRANGPLVEVGRLLPPSVNPHAVATEQYYTLDGASWGDLPDVFYSMSEAYWPGDTTELGSESLYEYVGTNNAAPLLVGVSGGAGSTSLLSKCGTSFDGVSENGDVVLFAAHACALSPRVQALYERIDNGQPDARTIAISEPSKEDCETCDTQAAVQRSAYAATVPVFDSNTHVNVFAVSKDGSRVFFTTSQPLLGDDESENLYEYDSENEAGQRIVRISGGDSTVSKPTADLEGVLSISLDGSHVYFLASGVLTTTPNALGQKAEAGRSNMYLYERDGQYPSGRTVFVLPYADLVKVSPYERNFHISQNGRFLAFNSTVHFTPDDLNSKAQAFEYDSQTGEFVRVSVGQNGFNEDGNTGEVQNPTAADDGSVLPRKRQSSGAAGDKRSTGHI